MKILVITTLDPRNTYDSGGVRTYNLNLMYIAEQLGYTLDFFATKEVKNLLKLNKRTYSDFDLIFINVSVFDTSIIKMLYEIIRIKDKRIVVQCHGGSFDTLTLTPLYRIFFKNLLKRKVELFLVLNEKQQDTLKDCILGTDERIRQIPNYVLNTYAVSEKDYNHPLRFFYIGRIVEAKGIFDFLEAFMEVRSDEMEFNVVGAGPDKPRLIELSRKDPRIKFHGNQFGAAKEKMLQENHIFVFLSKYPEGFPFAVLEALSYGMCILASRFPSSDKLVIHEYNGLFVENNREAIQQAIEFLRDNRDVVKEYGWNSKRLCQEKYSLETKGVECFKEIFGGHKS